MNIELSIFTILLSVGSTLSIFFIVDYYRRRGRSDTDIATPIETGQISHLEEEIAGLKAELEAERGRADMIQQDYRAVLKETTEGALEVVEQVKSLGGDPVWKPNGRSKSAQEGRLLVVELANLMESRFNDNELNSIMFALGIPRDAIASGALRTRIESLITYCQRRGWLGLLVEECQRQRPGTPWPKV